MDLLHHPAKQYKQFVAYLNNNRKLESNSARNLVNKSQTRNSYYTVLKTNVSCIVSSFLSTAFSHIAVNHLTVTIRELSS